MPVYEFYCPQCHMIFNFLVRPSQSAQTPRCPKCSAHEMERQPSRFAVSRGMKDDDESTPPGMDEDRVEQAMETLAAKAEGMDENNPRQMAALMKDFFSATGMELRGEMAEAMRRLESGEDPERIEESMGDVLPGGEDGMSEGPDNEAFSRFFGFKDAARRMRYRFPPRQDDTLYEIEPSEP